LDHDHSLKGAFRERFPDLDAPGCPRIDDRESERPGAPRYATLIRRGWTSRWRERSSEIEATWVAERSSVERYRISSNCWAMYLRILRRSLEHGESVPYEKRLDA
jgi:hypothetical protein